MRRQSARISFAGARERIDIHELGDAIPEIERINLGEDPPGRDTWVGCHRDLKRLARLRALLDLVIDRLAN